MVYSSNYSDKRTNMLISLTWKGVVNMDNVSIRLVKERTLVSKKKIRTPKDAVEIIAQEYKYLDREALFSVNLNTHNQPINFIKIGIAKPHSFMVWGYAIPFFLKKNIFVFQIFDIKTQFCKICMMIREGGETKCIRP